MINNITPLILTFNEAPNIERTLRRLTWAKRIVVIDSYSSDDTIAILREFPQVDVYQREFDTFASQCNYGLRHIKTDWALSLDADYVLTDDFIEELKSLRPQESTNSYSAKFKYCIFGKPLRGTMYPPRRVLYRCDKAIYVDDGHAHHVVVEGPTGMALFLHITRRQEISGQMAEISRPLHDPGSGKTAGGAARATRPGRRNAPKQGPVPVRCDVLLPDYSAVHI